MKPKDNDFIDFVDIIYLIWSKKTMILGLSLGLLVAIYFFSFFIAPAYEAKITILPPTQSDIAIFNMRRTGHSELRAISAAQEYNFFRGVLTAPEFQKNILSNFEDAFKISHKFLPLNRLEFAVTGSNAEKIKKVIETMLASAQKKTYLNLNNALLKELDALKKRIEEGKILLGIKDLAAELKTPQTIDRAHHEKLLKLERLQNEYNAAKSILPIEEGAVFYRRVADTIDVQEIYSRRKSFIVFSFLTGFILICAVIILLNRGLLTNNSFRKEKPASEN